MRILDTLGPALECVSRRRGGENQGTVTEARECGGLGVATHAAKYYGTVAANGAQLEDGTGRDGAAWQLITARHSGWQPVNYGGLGDQIQGPAT